MATVSRYATVETANLADDAVIGAFSYVGPEVTIGPGCVIEDNVTITGRTTLGEDNHVFPMAIIGSPAVEGDDGACEIGQANRIREHVTIASGAGDATRIAHDCLIMIGTKIGGSASIGSHVVLANFTTVGSRAVLEDYVRGSAFPVVDDGVTVGAYSFMKGYSHIDRDAPPFAMLEGDPYRVRGINTHNLQQCGFGQDDIRDLKRAYREIYDGNRRQPNRRVLGRMLANGELSRLVRQAVEVIAKEVPSE